MNLNHRKIDHRNARLHAVERRIQRIHDLRNEHQDEPRPTLLDDSGGAEFAAFELFVMLALFVAFLALLF